MRVNSASLVELADIHALNLGSTLDAEQPSITIPDIEIPSDLYLTVVAVKLIRNTKGTKIGDNAEAVFVIGLCSASTEVDTLKTELILVRDKERNENQIIMRSKYQAELHFLLGFILMNSVSN